MYEFFEPVPRGSFVGLDCFKLEHEDGDDVDDDDIENEESKAELGDL